MNNAFAWENSCLTRLPCDRHWQIEKKTWNIIKTKIIWWVNAFFPLLKRSLEPWFCLLPFIQNFKISFSSYLENHSLQRQKNTKELIQLAVKHLTKILHHYFTKYENSAKNTTVLIMDFPVKLSVPYWSKQKLKSARANIMFKKCCKVFIKAIK